MIRFLTFILPFPLNTLLTVENCMDRVPAELCMRCLHSFLLHIVLTNKPFLWRNWHMHGVMLMHLALPNVHSPHVYCICECCCFLCAVRNFQRSSALLPCGSDGESWHRHTGPSSRHRRSDLLHCHLRCRAAVFPMRQPEQWVEPMLVWLVWLGGKWKPLSRFSLCCIIMQSTGEVIWIAKAALAMLIWHRTILIAGWLSTCWFCFVLSCVLKWASLSTVTLNGLMFYWLGPAVQPPCHFGKNMTEISYFVPFQRWLRIK